ncbi:sensor histidine kinase [Tessaracoccus antarcticus]|uniref:histidine kinase n=1 Tax=Tessaracoccus antarcticus TaxID=2479848 RepID=A0A3M0G1S5_9ACTN|nr:HAMP domain-containing sensor histidine kinase [Tessaracoccus antarcticus]RMB58884.1 sensor histidine kinase [Tessaracoccus antarcticus]
MSVRWKLTLSYVGFLTLAGVLLAAVIWLFLLRYVPNTEIDSAGGFVPNRDDLIRAFAPKAAVVVVSLLAFALLGGWILAGRMLAPLDKIQNATRIATGGYLHHRIRLEGPSDEFRELADSFDVMLDRIEAHVAEQQRFAANASHELRTPLAITQALLDVAQLSPDRDTGEDLAKLRETNTRAIDVTEALLSLSRAGNALIGHDSVDLSLLAEEAAETLLPLSEDHGVSVAVSGSTAMTTGSTSLLLQMVTNLVHNAIVHNLPSGGTIWVWTSQDAHVASVTVENTGTVLTPQQAATLAEPFQRGSNRVRSDGKVGAGLGLAIVNRIVDAHAATLDLHPRVGGGLRVRARFPTHRTRHLGESQQPPTQDPRVGGSAARIGT